MSEIITRQSAIDSLKKAVAAKPVDYSYDTDRTHGGDGCVYFEDDGTPSCIVGHVLADHGYTLEDLDDLNVDTPVSSLTARSSYVSIAPDAVGVLSVAQFRQDRGNTWADSVEQAL